MLLLAPLPPGCTLCAQVFGHFIRILTDVKGSLVDAGDNEHKREGLEAWQQEALARLRVFTRRWRLAVAPLASQLESQTFADDSTAPEIRAAFLTSLYL